MYVDMQRIGNLLSGGQGWNDKGGRAARTKVVAGPYDSRFWKPDMSISGKSSGLLLSCKIDTVENAGQLDPHGALMVWYETEATLMGASLQWQGAPGQDRGETGVVSGSNPVAVGDAIARQVPDHLRLGSAARKAIIDFSQGVFRACKITSIKSGKALTVQPGSQTASGAALQTWDYTGGENQKWRMVPVSPHSFLIASFGSSKVVDVSGGSTANNAPIIQWNYTQGANQHWKINEIGNNDYTIESVASGKVLDVLDARTDNGAPVQQYGYGSALNQRWRIDGL